MGFQDPATIRPEDVLDGTLNPGVVLEGNVIRTAATGQRWELSSADINRFKAFSGNAAEAGPGGLTVATSGGRSDMSLAGTDMAGAGNGAALNLHTWDKVNFPTGFPDEAELFGEQVALAYDNTDRLLYDSHGRLYRELGSGLGFPYNVVLADYKNGWAAGAGSRGFWSYLGPDGFVTMGGRGSGAAISVATMRLPDTLNTPNGLDHRPKEQLHFICYANGAAVNVRIDVSGDVVQTSGTPTNLSLSNIRFPVF